MMIPNGLLKFENLEVMTIFNSEYQLNYYQEEVFFSLQIKKPSVL